MTAAEKSHRIKRRILIPVFIAVVSLMIISIVGIYHLNNAYINADFFSKVERLNCLFRMELNEDAKLMQGLIDFIEKDRRFQKAFQEKNREELYEKALPVFEDIRKKYRVTHFYFIEPDRKCFLRIHNPSGPPNIVKHWVMKACQRSAKTSWGIELGRYGTFTLRVIRPWKVNGKLIGYIELGEEIEHITEKLKNILNLDIIFTVYKSFMDKKRWITGIEVTQKRQAGEWDSFRNFVIIASTIKNPTELIKNYLMQNRNSADGIEEEKNRILSVSSASGKYLQYFEPLIDAEGKIVGNIIVIEDITAIAGDLRHLIKTLVISGVLIGGLLLFSFFVYVNRLEKTILYGTLELRKARDMAEDATRSKSEFLANMSHEIRTPINAIMGFTELSLEGDLSEEQRENLTIVRSRINDLLVLINDILDFSKIEAQKMELVPVRINMKELLEDIEYSLSPKVESKGLFLSFQVHTGGIDKVKGDPVRIRQIFMNLLTNAVKFTYSGGITVKMTAEKSDENENIIKYICSIEDTGIGISEEAQMHVFDAFSQDRTPESVQYGGAGLGLSISRNLIRMMGGDISLESEKGVGSKFKFTIFLESAAENAEEDTRSKGIKIQPGMFKGLRVLVAEDEPINRKLIEKILGREGIEVSLAENGQKAFEKATKEDFDLILMDMQMPVMDGYEAVIKIREHEKASGKKHIPIAAFTARAMDGDREKCLGAGMDDYIPKPVRKKDLFRVINDFCCTDQPS